MLSDQVTAPRRIRLRALVATVLIVLAGIGAGGWLLAGAGGDATRRDVVVDGVPLYEVHPPTAAGERRPGVVVAHGFAGSARLMAQFGDSLSARGYVVVLLDFAGHGANTHPLPDAVAGTDASTEGLSHDLDVALTHLRGLPDVDSARIALVGHSMGAGAVTRYAAAHPEITATVAISLPDAPAALPSRLLLLVGGLEFPDFKAAAEKAASDGEGRSMVVVPSVEHISILFASRTHQAIADWLGASFGDPVTADRLPSPVRRVSGAGVLMSALLLGMYPVARLLLGDDGGGGWPRLKGARIGRTVVVAVVAAALAALVARVLPTVRLPLAVGGYVVGYTAVAGALLLAYVRLRGSIGPQLASPGRRRLAIAVPVLIAYAAVTIAVPMHLGLTNAVPVGARWWLLALVWAGFALLAYGAERLTGVLAVYLIVVVVLTGAAMVGLTSGFVLLVVPLLAVLLLFQAFWSAVLHRFAAPAWLIALVGSLVVAWPVATTLPVIG